MGTLRSRSAQAQKEMLTPRPECPEDEAVWEATLLDVESGSIRGPLTEAQIIERLGAQWTGARRFAIVQNGKVRPIDDFSEFGINDAFGSEEKISMKGIDQIVAWTKAWSESLKADRRVS